MESKVVEVFFSNSDKICLIDAEDADKVLQYKWSVIRSFARNTETFYAVAQAYIDGKKTTLSMHRFIMDCPELMIVDHLNCNGLDNRKSNLEIVTYSENTKRSYQRRNALISQ